MMTNNMTGSPAQAGRHSDSIMQILARTLHDLKVHMAQKKAQKAARMALHGLNDHMLRDIGVSRADLFDPAELRRIF